MRELKGTLTYVTGEDRFFFEKEDGTFYTVKFAKPISLTELTSPVGEIRLNEFMTIKFTDERDNFGYDIIDNV